MNNQKTDPYDVRFGRAIAFHRKQVGMSQQELGSAIGVTYQQISKYEDGKNRVGMSRAFHIAAVLQVPLMAMIEMAGMETAGPNIDRKASRMLRSFQRIESPPVKEKLLRLVEAISDDQHGPN